ncbi:MAG TPA: hypothetical protein VEA59_02225, partial [Patescibacteria group bacterium]|nr:hypothetical protein [Patescibacteria group bacterium]
MNKNKLIAAAVAATILVPSITYAKNNDNNAKIKAEVKAGSSRGWIKNHARSIQGTITATQTGSFTLQAKNGTV